MNAKETRQYETLLRVNDFETIHRRLFTEQRLAIETFADVAAIVEELAATHLTTMTASVSARAARKVAARAALYDLLVKVSHTAKVLRTRGRTARRVEGARGPRNGAGDQPTDAATNADAAPTSAAA